MVALKAPGGIGKTRLIHEFINSTLKEAYRVLKPGGRFLCLEFSKVKNKFLNKFYKTYSNTIPQIGKLVLGKSEPYEYLINSIEKFSSQEELFKQIKKQNWVMALALAEDYGNTNLSSYVKWLDITRPGSKHSFAYLTNFFKNEYYVSRLTSRP